MCLHVTSPVCCLPLCRYECLPNGGSAWIDWQPLVVLIEGPTEPPVMDAFLKPVVASLKRLAPPKPSLHAAAAPAERAGSGVAPAAETPAGPSGIAGGAATTATEAAVPGASATFGAAAAPAANNAGAAPLVVLPTADMQLQQRGP